MYTKTMHDSEVTKLVMDSASEKASAAEFLYEGKHYLWALFTYHLVIEKTLKALIVQKGKEVPFIHKLDVLAELAEIELSETETNELLEITTYNIEARYEDYKKKQYKKANELYTESWMGTCRRLYNKYKQIYEQRASTANSKEL
jgi:HEPN domain-containing protein